MRAVMSGASRKERPRRKASKKRGGSYIRSSTSSTEPSRITTRIAPSPSTRARKSVLIVRRPFVLAMGLALLTEGLGGRVISPERSEEVAVGGAEALHPPGEGSRVRALHRTEAAVAATVVGRADRATPRVRHRAKARRPVGHHHTDVAAPLALDANAVGRDRGTPLVQVRAQHLEQLVLVDRTAVELVVDRDVRADRGGGLERGDVLRRRIDDGHEVIDVGEVPERLDAAGRRAGADRDQTARGATDVLDPLRVLAVEQAELAPVAGRELPDRQLLLAHLRHQSSGTESNCSIAA